MKKTIVVFMCCIFLYEAPADSVDTAGSDGAISGRRKDNAASFNLFYLGSLSFDVNKKTGMLENRINGHFFLPGQAFYLRTELLERNPFPVGAFTSENLNWGTGLYHKETGSRLLYGMIEEWGLPARVRNTWSRSAPFVEQHQPTGYDLIQSYSTTKEQKAGIFLASPKLDFLSGITGFTAVTLDGRLNSAFSGGVELWVTRKSSLRTEGFWTGKELRSRSASGWFSEKPALPERGFHLFALAFLWTSPWVNVSSDWAFSETAAFGRGVYGNIGVRIGRKPWLFSFAADGAGDRFVGSDGGIPGQSVRIAGKIEHYGKKSSLFRVSTSLRSLGLGDLFEADCDAGTVFAGGKFERSSTGLYYRFPVWTKLPVRISRIALSANRDATEEDKVQDTYKTEIGAYWWNLRSSFSCALSGVSADNPSQNFSPYPIPERWRFDSARIAGRVVYSVGLFQVGVGAGYTIHAKADNVDGSFSTTVQGKRYRFTIKITSSAFPTAWEYGLSGRFNV
ncbi:MAG: hypothetical protein LBB61_10430 [Treponema sp.]|jgi:hypothetical protein|nr:hypothetical protein [Treponema sp.]